MLGKGAQRHAFWKWEEVTFNDIKQLLQYSFYVECWEKVNQKYFISMNWHKRKLSENFEEKN